MQKHQPDLMPPFPMDARHKIEQGNLIDEMAQNWFVDHYMTKDQKSANHKAEFQFRAEDDHFLVVADILLLKDGKKCDLYEVKASTGEKPEHADDIAFQKMVFEKAGYEVEKVFLIHVNNAYKAQNPQDIRELLTVKDLTLKVDERMALTKRRAEDALEWLKMKELPLGTIQVGCSKKANCPYILHYHAPLPDYSIFDIRRLSAEKMQALADRGILDVHDVPEDFELSANQRRQVDLARKGRAAIEKAEILEIIENLPYPLYFLDYETFSYVIPPRRQMRPYQHMVFQYSLHAVRSPGGDTEHSEYLLPSKEASVAELIEHLASNINTSEGTVIVWNKNFEKARNEEMAGMFPRFSDFLLSLNERVFDLMTIFSRGLYQHPEFKGSASIKNVLPVLCPDLSYTALEIQSGTSAVINWHHMTDGRMSAEQAEQTRRDLLAYCELDTWAMVRIWQELSTVREAA